jgi:hypothetical protein
MNCERTSYRGWGNAYVIANRDVEIVVAADIGPRVLSYRVTEGENQFYLVPEQAGLTGGGQPRLYGGHRLWAAPETSETFEPDNSQVEVSVLDKAARFTAGQSSGHGTTLEKALEISLNSAGTHCRVTNRITNTGDKPCYIGPWAITMLLPGGKAIVPLGRRSILSASTLNPDQAVVLWPYTDLSDPRWKIWQTYIEFSASASACSVRYPQQKLGIRSQSAWAAYLRHGTLFVKRTNWYAEKEYPDLGCNFEVYAEDAFLELESLGPLEHLKPREVLTHVEGWWLFPRVADGSGDDWLEREVVPRIPQLSPISD